MATDFDAPQDWTRRQTAQASAFDEIGAGYDQAFPHKEGQLEASDWLSGQLPAGARVLDIGVGTGLPTARRLQAAGLSITGMDISAGMLDLARRNVPGAELHQRDVLDLDDSVGRFDAVVAFFTLLMLPRSDIPEALRRIHAILDVGGLFALGMVEADLDDAPIPFLGRELRVTGYPRDELSAVVEKAGFAVTDLREYAYEPTSPQAPPEVQLFLYCHRD